MDETLNEIQSKTCPRDWYNMQPGMIEEIMVKGHKPAKIK